MSINPNSRNNFAVTRRMVDGSGNATEFDQLDIRQHVTRTSHPDNRVLTLRPKESWSHLSWRTLGNGKMWWIIADYSRTVDPFRELRERTSLSLFDSLAQDIPPGPAPTFIRVASPHRFQKGQRLLVEDMLNFEQVELAVVGKAAPGSPDMSVINVTASVSIPAWIRAATSRIMLATTIKPRLTAPTTARALFECFDFRNPAITADE